MEQTSVSRTVEITVTIHNDNEDVVEVFNNFSISAATALARLEQVAKDNGLTHSVGATMTVRSTNSKSTSAPF